MISLPLYNIQGEKIGEEKVDPEIFGIEINPNLVHRYVEIYLGNIRKNIASTKTRSEVRGGGRKPWKQKGTGRARAGSIRSPLWKGGGVTFGPSTERNYTRKLNKKERKKALLMVISSKFSDKKIVLVDKFDFKDKKTKEAALMLKNLKIKNNNALVVMHKVDENVARLFRNIKNLNLEMAANLNAYNVLTNKYLVLSKDSLEVLNKMRSE